MSMASHPTMPCKYFQEDTTNTLLDMVKLPLCDSHPNLLSSIIIPEAAITSVILHKNLRVCKIFIGTDLCHTGMDTLV